MVYLLLMGRTLWENNILFFYEQIFIRERQSESPLFLSETPPPLSRRGSNITSSWFSSLTFPGNLRPLLCILCSHLWYPTHYCTLWLSVWMFFYRVMICLGLPSYFVYHWNPNSEDRLLASTCWTNVYGIEFKSEKERSNWWLPEERVVKGMREKGKGKYSQ